MVNNQNYFIYQGVAYGVGTTVLLSEKAKPHTYAPLTRNYTHEKIKQQPHTYVYGTSDGCAYFDWKEDDYNNFYPTGFASSHIKINNLDEEIESIVKPVYVELVPWKKQAFNNMVDKKVYADVFNGVLIYIIVMLVGIVFNARWLIWIFATIIFIIWLLNQYRN